VIIATPLRYCEAPVRLVMLRARRFADPTAEGAILLDLARQLAGLHARLVTSRVQPETIVSAYPQLHETAHTREGHECYTSAKL